MTHQPDISDEAVLKATGRSWREWFDLLAGENMAQRPHEEIMVFLREDHGVPSWWQQSIATEYERSIGRRSNSETDDGFQMDDSWTLDFSPAALFAAWADEGQRSKWLRRGDFELTTVREPGTLRGKWIPDDSWIDVEISEADGGRSQLTLKHGKLPGDVAVERMRQFWQQSIQRLVDRIGNAK